MLTKFIKLCLIFILIGGAYIAYKQPDVMEKVMSLLPDTKMVDFPSVKGLNTDRATEISDQLREDFYKAIEEAKKQGLELKLSDFLNFFNRGQQIAGDFKEFQEYVKKEIDKYVGEN